MARRFPADRVRHGGIPIGFHGGLHHVGRGRLHRRAAHPDARGRALGGPGHDRRNPLRPLLPPAHDRGDARHRRLPGERGHRDQHATRLRPVKGSLQMRRLLSVASITAALLGLAGVPTAIADAGFRDFSYRDANRVETPTADKPQSKLWFQDGSWWGVLYSPVAGATRVHRLEPSTQSWVDTGTTVDTRANARADVLWDGSKLYVLSATTVFFFFFQAEDGIRDLGVTGVQTCAL